MWLGRAACFCVIALLVFQPVTEESKDRWLGCWTRIYDADHVAKHEAQDITAIKSRSRKRPWGRIRQRGAASASFVRV